MEIQVIPETIHGIINSYILITVNGIFVVLFYSASINCVSVWNTKPRAYTKPAMCLYWVKNFIHHLWLNTFTAYITLFCPFSSPAHLFLGLWFISVLISSLSHNYTFYWMVVCMLQILLESHNCTKAVRYGERGGHCCSHIVMLSRHE